MSAVSALDISTSALVAQRTRLDTISSNLANAFTVRDANGELKPFSARSVIFETDDSLSTPAGAVGVEVAEVVTEQKEPKYEYRPGHPLAIKEGEMKGFIAYPNINMTREFVDALEATRAYEANIGVMEVSKSMGQQTLRILA